MFKIIKDGKTLGVTDTLLRCATQKNGKTVIDANGPGIIWGGQIYNLPGHETVLVEQTHDVRLLVEEMIGESQTATDLMLAIAELGQIVGGE